MPLPTEVWDRLLTMTREHRPSIEISRWLTRECGIPFPIAAQARADALKEVGLDIFTQSDLAQANLNVYHAKLEREKKSGRKADRRAREAQAHTPLFHSDVLPSIPIERVPEKPSCVSCGSETFECDCEVKTVDAIPF